MKSGASDFCCEYTLDTYFNQDPVPGVRSLVAGADCGDSRRDPSAVDRIADLRYRPALSIRGLAAFTGGVKVALSAAQASLAAASEEQKKLATEVAELESTIATEAARIEAAVSSTRLATEHARIAAESAQEAQKKAIAEHASQVGRLEELRRQRGFSGLSWRGEPVARSSGPSCRRTRPRTNGDRS